jgi:hypothetical protein
LIASRFVRGLYFGVRITVIVGRIGEIVGLAIPDEERDDDRFVRLGDAYFGKENSESW